MCERQKSVRSYKTSVHGIPRLVGSGPRGEVTPGDVVVAIAQFERTHGVSPTFVYRQPGEATVAKR
jgi:hypothetical protein